MRAIVLASLLVGCAPLGLVGDPEPAADPCAEAARIFEGCGASLAYLYPERCVGPSLVIAECVVDHGATCDDLATLDVEDCVRELTDPGEDPVEPLDPIGLLPETSDGVPDVSDDETGDAACADGSDNDGDGYFDCDDADCSQDPTVTVCGAEGPR
ncbi:MAG: hypothetical protein AB7S26_16120 [Sandaracinaceae bacterium]